MNRRAFLLTGATLLPTLAIEAAASGATLNVRVNYTGSGTVDKDHRIFVALWDSPDFIKEGNNSAMPIAVEPVTSKTGTATFQNVQKNLVYASAAYDPTGNWDSQSEPPAGTSLGLYAKEPGTPSAITLKTGQSATVSLTFDDSYKRKD